MSLKTVLTHNNHNNNEIPGNGLAHINRGAAARTIATFQPRFSVLEQTSNVWAEGDCPREKPGGKCSKEIFNGYFSG